MRQDYQEFLEAKAPLAQASGIEPQPISAPLFDFQRAAVEFCLRRGRAALFLDTGLGKTLCELEFATQTASATNHHALILAPLAVAKQIEREAARFGYDARVIREAAEVQPGINICNYDRLEKLDPAAFGCVILDECFAQGTEIDVPGGRKRIEDIQSGDYILNCSGVDRVSDTHRREVQYAVLVEVAGASFIASPNHPVFTQRGWVGAQHLRSGDHALATGAAMRLVRDGICATLPGFLRPEVLRDIMLSEMAYDPKGNTCAGSFSRSSREAGKEESGLVCSRFSGGAGRTGEDHSAQPDIEARSESKDFGRVESHEARTIRAWGQWQRHDIAASIDDGCSGFRLDSGVSVISGPKEARIPHMLQDGLRKSEAESFNRGGWRVAPIEKESGRQTGCDDPFSRVDGITILKPGDYRLEQLRDADGKLYFYDLGATRHPSYSVSGHLVHNSSILKSFMGKTTRALIAAFADTPFRLCATATPAPNDHTELGTHAEFLGIMAHSEMLVRWFINDSNDTGTWRLKGHAVNAFWDWCASWAVMAETPEDLGFDGSRFILPPMNIVRHRADSSVVVTDGLFGFDVSATAIHDLKRQTTEARSEAAGNLVKDHPDDAWVVWVDTDYEADAVMKRLTDAREVRGSHVYLRKEVALDEFAKGTYRQIVTKPSVAGYGLNWQHCHNMCFLGRSFSYEAWYQAVRRCWRFGQTKAVNVHIIVAEGEDQIGRVIDRKAEDHAAMKNAMRAATRRQFGSDARKSVPYNPTFNGRLPPWLSDA